MSWLDHHRLSEQNAITAEQFKREEALTPPSAESLSTYYYGRAAEEERAALDAFLETENAYTKTRSIAILSISVAALLMKAKQNVALVTFVEDTCKDLPLTDVTRQELTAIVEKSREPAV